MSWRFFVFVHPDRFPTDATKFSRPGLPCSKLGSDPLSLPLSFFAPANTYAPLAILEAFADVPAVGFYAETVQRLPRPDFLVPPTTQFFDRPASRSAMPFFSHPLRAVSVHLFFPFLHPGSGNVVAPLGTSFSGLFGR